jgi:hypothetical protein
MRVFHVEMQGQASMGDSIGPQINQGFLSLPIFFGDNVNE